MEVVTKVKKFWRRREKLLELLGATLITFERLDPVDCSLCPVSPWCRHLAFKLAITHSVLVMMFAGLSLLRPLTFLHYAWGISSVTEVVFAAFTILVVVRGLIRRVFFNTWWVQRFCPAVMVGEDIACFLWASVAATYLHRLRGENFSNHDKETWSLALAWCCCVPAKHGVELCLLRMKRIHETRHKKSGLKLGGNPILPQPGFLWKSNCFSSSGATYFPYRVFGQVQESRVDCAGFEDLEDRRVEAPKLFLRCSCCITLGDAICTPPTLKSAGNIDGISSTDGRPFDRLCQRCQWICSTSRVLRRRIWARRFRICIRDREVFEYHSSPAQLQRSAAAGCHLCVLIWTSLSPQQQAQVLEGDQNGREIDAEEVRNVASLVDRQTLSLRHGQARALRLAIEAMGSDVPHCLDGYREDMLWQKVIFGQKPKVQMIPHFGSFMRPRKWMSHVPGHEGKVFDDLGEFVPPLLLMERRTQRPERISPSQSTGSDVTMSLIAQFLAETTAFHRPQLEQDVFLPGRLVDVSLAIQRGIIFIRDRADILMDEDSSNNPPGFSVLSHVWGSTDFLTFNRLTAWDFRVGIEVSRLTRNFRDAISTTARVGYRYLWIDSLCILQDDPVDKDKELRTMCDVYQHASFTIVAAAAQSSDEGFFRAQDPLEASPCSIGRLSVLPARLEYGHEWHTEVELSKWNTRGWCFQELILSSRIVYFGRTQVHLEVKEAGILHARDALARNSGEFDPPGTISQFQDTHLTLSHHMRLAPLDRSWENFAHNDMHIWWRFVYDFSQRKLRSHSDKGAAIDGLARFLQRKGHCMTFDDFQHRQTSDSIASLLWFVHRDRAIRPPAGLESPSWSWLSVGGTILNDSADFVKLESCGVEWLDFVFEGEAQGQSDDTMAIASRRGTGVLCSGLVAPATWEYKPGQFYRGRGARGHDLVEWDTQREEWSRSEHFYGMRNVIKAFDPISASPSDGPAAYDLISEHGKKVGWFMPDTKDALPTELCCLRIYVGSDDSSQQDQMPIEVVRGLALRRLDDSGSIPAYERVGYIELEQNVQSILPDMASELRRFGGGNDDWYPAEVRNQADVDPSAFFDTASDRHLLVIR